MKIETLLMFVAEAMKFISRLWDSDDSDDALQVRANIIGALGVASGLVDNLARGSDAPTLHSFIIQARGYIKVQLAPYIDHADHPPDWVVAALEAIVFDGIATYVKLHPPTKRVVSIG